MNRRHFCFYLLCFVLCLSLSGCAVKPAAEAPAVTIPPTEVSYVAPIGDAALEYSEEVTLCLPMHDGIRLSTVTSEVSFSPVRPYAENVVRALLGYTGNGEIRSIGGDVRLTLYGTSPVEVSRNVATVNLGASALQLSRQDLYVACQSIANTLTLLDEIDYVNVLVAGKPVGLDVANSLPMGSLTGSAAQDLGAAYGQLISRPDSDMALSTTLTLYFPLADALADYLKERKTMEPATPEDQNALFLSLQRKRITQRAVQKMVKKYCALAVPLKKRMSPHKLRSTYATRLYHETEDIYLVAEALGHSDVNTTRKHYAAMSDQRRREAAQNTHLPTNEK